MTQPNIKKNFAYTTAFQILSLITPFVTAPYVSRVLGPEGTGIYSFTSANVAYFTMFAALGTVSYGAHTIARQRDDREAYSKSFWEIELLTIATSLICLLAWFGFILITNDSNRVYYLILTMSILGTMFDITWFFKGLEMFKVTVLRSAVFKLLGVAAIFLFVKASTDVAAYVAIMSASTMLSMLSLWMALPKLLAPVDWHALNLRPHLRETLVFFVPTIASSIYLVLDRTLLGIITGNNAENGYYQQAEKIIGMGKAVVYTSINSVLTTRISYLFSQKKLDEIRRRIGDSMNYILTMGCGCTFGIMGIAKRFVPVFFGDGYEPVITLLYIFAPILVVIGVSNCLGTQYFTPAGRKKDSNVYLLVGAGVNLCLNLILIPRFASFGAAAASLAAETVITILYIRNSPEYLTFGQLGRIAWKKLLSGLVMLAAVVALGQLPIGAIPCLVVQVGSGVAVYGAMLLLLRDEWVLKMAGRVLSRVLRRKKG